MPGLRAAVAGEFTRRAFDNGRIDLAEAEGLADLLAAETESQRVQALGMASGHVSRAVAAWQDRLLTLMAAAAAELNFSDEDDVHAYDDAAQRLVTAMAPLAADPGEVLAPLAAAAIGGGAWL